MDMAFRIKTVIEREIPEEKRYKDLAVATEIGADSWRKLFDNKQRPTMQMIDAVCNLWPQYAFWIATGIDDCESGHIAAAPTMHPEAEIERNADTDFFKAYLRLSRLGLKSGKL